ncbi:unnamed protein product [Dicrocoelium dendriticum]|nr:unnamed protein product [Dicrocoelium dendriticum]
MYGAKIIHPSVFTYTHHLFFIFFFSVSTLTFPQPTQPTGYDMRSSSSSESAAVHPAPDTRHSNGSSTEAHLEVSNVVTSSANSCSTNSPVIVRPSPPASEPTICYATQIPFQDVHPSLSSVPRMSFGDPSNERDVKSSELQDHTIPAFCSSPRGHTASSFQGAPQRFHPANNVTTCSLLMSESVYVPVTSHLSVPLVDLSDREATALTPRSASSGHICNASPSSVRAAATTRPFHSPPPHSHLLPPDSLDPNTSQELESSRVTLVPECLRDTLQSSFSFIPLNKSVESEPSRIQPTPYRAASEFAQSVSPTKPPVSRLHLINKVHMITDDEDSDEVGHRIPRDHSSPRAPRPRSHEYASLFGAPDDAPHVDSVDIDQLLSRSRLPPDETVARSLDSWIHAAQGFNPSNGLTDTYGMSKF